MVNICLEPLEPFNFSKPDNWPKWKRHFQQYLTVSGLAKEEEPQQVSTRFYCLGDRADDVLTSINIMPEDQESMMAKFDKFFKVRRKVILNARSSTAKAK